MEEKGFDYINVIPFVDIMLVLLTIVLTTSTFIATGGISVKLPTASQDKTEARRVKTIEIDDQGRLFFDGKLLTLPLLSERIRGLDKQTPFLIRADRDIDLQSFVDVLNAVKCCGFVRVSLQTEANR